MRNIKRDLSKAGFVSLEETKVVPNHATMWLCRTNIMPRPAGKNNILRINLGDAGLATKRRDAARGAIAAVAEAALDVRLGTDVRRVDRRAGDEERDGEEMEDLPPLDLRPRRRGRGGARARAGRRAARGGRAAGPGGAAGRGAAPTWARGTACAWGRR